MRPRHDARLVPAALLAYACAGLLTGQVMAPTWVVWGAAGGTMALVGALAQLVWRSRGESSAASARGTQGGKGGAARNTAVGATADLAEGRVADPALGPVNDRAGGVAVRPRRLAWLISLGSHLVLSGVVIAVIAVGAAGHMAARWEGGFHAAVDSPVVVDICGTVNREPVPLSAPGFDGAPRHRVELVVQRWRPTGTGTDCEAGPRPSISAGTGAVPDREPAREAGEGIGASPVEISGHWHAAAATIEVIGAADIAELAYGDQVALTTTLAEVRGERAVAIAWDAAVTHRTAATGFAGVIARVREDFRSATAGLPVTVQGLSRGMVIGDTRAMPARQRDDMREAGLSHLTAVSGAHFAVVAVLLHAVLRRLRLRRALRACGAAIGMAGFACLVFPDASVVRALVMALVGAVAVWWGRPAQALPALATAVIVLVFVDPFVALEPGFALSVSAVAAIILWAPRLRALLGRVMAPTLAMLVSVPLAAQAACAPILILLEPRVSLYAVGANLLAAPFAAPVTLVGLGAVLMGPASPMMATWAAGLASVAVWPVAGIARWAASLPGSTLSWPAGFTGAVTLAALTAVVMWWTVARGSRYAKVLAAVVALALVVVAARTDRVWEWASPVPSAWAIVACDVGQGDMMLLRAGAHSAVVIDTGPGEGTAAACLRRYSISLVPLLILTHPHADHDGAVAEVMDAAQVEAAWVPQVALTAGFDDAARVLVAGGVSVTVPAVGARWSEAQTAVVVRQARPVRPAPAPGARVDGTILNDASLVVSGEADGVSLLALGDVEDGAQQDLDERLRGTITVDVVKVPHHGSQVQDAALVERIAAGVAVVSVGAGNTYGHPSARALDLFGATGARIVRTDLCADVVVWRNPGLRVASGCQ